MVPGYVVIKPDFPECITRFGFLWFEDEYTVDAAATWVLEANAADAIVREGRLANLTPPLRDGRGSAVRGTPRARRRRAARHR